LQDGVVFVDAEADAFEGGECPGHVAGEKKGKAHGNNKKREKKI
jgi:hypothetical protein